MKKSKTPLHPIKITTYNPATEKSIDDYPLISWKMLEKKLQQAKQAQIEWSQVDLANRAKSLLAIADLLEKNRTIYSHLITTEMGKPLKQAESEVTKCRDCCLHYAKHAEGYLQDITVKTGPNSKAAISYQPLGIVLAIMPWNFPFWQVIRCLIPNLMAGNGLLLKHAPNTTGSALALEHLVKEAGLPEHLFKTLIIETDMIPQLINHPNIAAITLTGSLKTGRIVSELAGKALKKTVMELGGNDPYLILDDNTKSSLQKLAENCVAQRMRVSGQVCISPKRFIVTKRLYPTFLKAIVSIIKDYQPQDPLNPRCYLGPLARQDLRHQLHQQIQQSIDQGAICLHGGTLPHYPGFYYPATLLVDIPQTAPAYYQELFGPVISLFCAENQAHAIAIANDSPYGLGAGIFTENRALGEQIARDHLQVGQVAVNTWVSSNPSLPFGGIKQSGYGRELGEQGIKAFTNCKVISTDY